MGEKGPNAGGALKRLTVFYSWQSDTAEEANKKLLQDCLDEAVKQIKKADALVVRVDRDTKGEAGSPGIAETILKKIRSADVFFGDVTLTYSTPEPAPNPNVAVEYGYALAVLGEGKIVAAMNAAMGKPEGLPFDLAHRRWPIEYHLSAVEAVGNGEAMAKAKAHITGVLVDAIRGAAKEPRRSAFFVDTDLHVAGVLWNRINPRWMAEWSYARRFREQYEERSTREAIQSYVIDARQPHLAFAEEALQASHEAFVRALAEYLNVLAHQMTRDPGNAALFVLSAALEEWSEHYDERFEKQADAVMEAHEGASAAWGAYVWELRRRYPEIVFAEE